MSEPVFISHCDDGGCDLGSVEYDCPACGRANRDFGQFWWDRYSTPAYSQCEKCKTKLVMLSKDYDCEIVVDTQEDSNAVRSS